MSEPLGRGRLSNSGDGPGDIRLWPLVFVVLALFTLFIGRLFQLQILEGRISREPLPGELRPHGPARRAARHDRRPRWACDRREPSRLSRRRDAQRDQAVPGGPTRFSARSSRAIRTTLSAKVGRPKGRLRFQPVSLSKDLSFEQRAQVAEHRYALPGVEFYLRPLREYVYGDLAAQLLGTIGEIDPAELAREEFADYRSGETIGKTGIEASYEVHLRGRDGGVNRIVDVAGREIEELDRIEPTPGGRVVLAMDLDLQRAAEAAFLNGRSDTASPDGRDRRPRSRTMATCSRWSPRRPTTPTPSPARFRSEIWRALNSDEWHPMRNRAVAGVYPPGSTYKAFVAAAGLAEKAITPSQTTHCSGYYRLGRRDLSLLEEGRPRHRRPPACAHGIVRRLLLRARPEARRRDPRALCEAVRARRADGHRRSGRGERPRADAGVEATRQAGGMDGGRDDLALDRAGRQSGDARPARGRLRHDRERGQRRRAAGRPAQGDLGREARRGGPGRDPRPQRGRSRHPRHREEGTQGRRHGSRRHGSPRPGPGHQRRRQIGYDPGGESRSS